MKSPNGKLTKKERVTKGRNNRKTQKELGHKCVYCKCENRLILTVDHKLPIGRGGKDEESNKQVCCFICNQLKGALTDPEFRKYLKALYEMHDVCRVFLNVCKHPSIKVQSRILSRM